MGQTAKKRTEPEQPGDVKQTWASVDKAQNLLGYNPETTLEEGLNKFYQWFKTNQ
jgi:UDP-glucuronate 4-epimerase